MHKIDIKNKIVIIHSYKISLKNLQSTQTTTEE